MTNAVGDTGRSSADTGRAGRIGALVQGYIDRGVHVFMRGQVLVAEGLEPAASPIFEKAE